VKCAKL